MFKSNIARQTGGSCGCGGAPAQVGGFSDYMSSFYSSGAVGGPGAISRFTLSGINNAPMFNPLSSTAVVPTLPSTGIVPSEIYLANMKGGAAKRRPVTRAVGKASDSVSLDRLRAECNKAGLSCRYKNGKYLPRATLVKLLKSNEVKK
jgi:hypothetical protein